MKKIVSLTKGFTLIELLVVIAIIGILAAIILPNLNNARTKGKDAKVEATLNNLRSQAELFAADNGNNYTNLFVSGSWDSADAKIKSLLDSIAAEDAGGAMFANSAVDSWVAVAQLPTSIGTTSAFWCVDNKGTSKLWGGASNPDSSVAACQ